MVLCNPEQRGYESSYRSQINPKVKIIARLDFELVCDSSFSPLRHGDTHLTLQIQSISLFSQVSDRWLSTTHETSSDRLLCDHNYKIIMCNTSSSIKHFLCKKFSYLLFFILFFASFSHECKLVVFPWGLSDSKFTQVSWNILGILADFSKL